MDETGSHFSGLKPVGVFRLGDCTARRQAQPQFAQQTPELRIGQTDGRDGVSSLDRALLSRREQLPEPLPAQRIKAPGDGLFRLQACSFLCSLAGVWVVSSA